MPIDVDRALSTALTGLDFRWAEDDVILYNLAVGAGDPPTDPVELRYAFEGDLVAVPTFATIPPFAMMMSLGGLDGLDISLADILHGSQELTIHRPIPLRGDVTQAGRIVDIFDRGRGALIVLEVVSTLDGDDSPLFTNRSSVYVRGQGGFGGDPGPTPGDKPPDRAPDLVVESATIPQQALLYRMASGDKNPLHADPAFASLAGFERPILHGLCTYGVVAKAVVDHVLGGDAGALRWFGAKFSGHVFPGETLRTSIWRVAPDRLVVETATVERSKRVLSNAALVAS